MFIEIGINLRSIFYKGPINRNQEDRQPMEPKMFKLTFFSKLESSHIPKISGFLELKSYFLKRVSRVSGEL